MAKGKVLAADYHRNGISGCGFYVAIVDDVKEGKMLVVTFDTDKYGYTAAFNLEKLKEEEIRFFHNSWRGDNYQDAFKDAIIAKAHEVD